MEKLRSVLHLSLLASICAAGCATHAESGAATGGLLGASAGALVGSHKGNAGPGALIGGVLGAMSGSIVGASIDESERRNEVAIDLAEARVAPGPMTVDQIVRMTQSGMSDDVIISAIRSSNTIFPDIHNQALFLHQQGVSDIVLKEMMQRTQRTPVIHHQPIIYQRRPVIVAPPPVRFHYGHNHCW